MSQLKRDFFTNENDIFSDVKGSEPNASITEGASTMKHSRIETTRNKLNNENVTLGGRKSSRFHKYLNQP